MIFWKEWRELRGRFLILAAFYLITVLILPIGAIVEGASLPYLAIALLGSGAILGLIPMVLGMDAYVGERDNDTEDFLFSKPMPVSRLLLAKIGLRAGLILLLSLTLIAIVLIRIGRGDEPLYLGTPPYQIWYAVLSILVGLLIILLITTAVSVRAPYQSTALIIGGSAGAVLAVAPVIFSAWELQYLQAPWSSFWLHCLMMLLSAIAAAVLIIRRETGRSPA